MLNSANLQHPTDNFSNPNLFPTAWCTGCSIGSVVNVFIKTVERSKLETKKIYVVSGLGCTGRISDYLKFKSFQVTDSHVISFAASLKLRHPASRVVVFVTDVDFIAADSGEFIGVCKKGAELLVIYINSYIYRVLVEHRRNTVVPFMGRPAEESVESPFNMPYFAKMCGASYVARWTPLHTRRLGYSMTDALQKAGFSMIEVVIPCLLYYASNNAGQKLLDRMQFFYDNTEINNNEPIQNLDLRNSNKIIVGTFVNI